MLLSPSLSPGGHSAACTINVTGALEFVPAMEYPEGPSLGWSVDADDMQMQERADIPSSSDVLLPTAAAAAAAGKAMRAEDWDTSDAVEQEDGSLSAPIVYASLVLGMITMFKSTPEEHVSFEERIQGGGVVKEGDRGVGSVLSVADDVTAAPEGKSAAVASAPAWAERVSG